MKRIMIAAIIAMFATPALAADFEFTFAKTAPAHQTYQNLENAAERHCKSWGRKPLAEMRRQQRCYDLIIDEVVDAIGDQQLASLHDAVKRGERPRQLAEATRAPRG